MLTGVNDSSKETKFVSGAYKLVEGKHLENGYKNKILMHKDLAEKNNLKVGDKIKIKSNLLHYQDSYHLLQRMLHPGIQLYLLYYHKL